MKILINQLGKRYRHTWIYKNITLELNAPDIVAILGDNGSGKSTLLRIIAGMQSHNAGSIKYQIDEKGLKEEQLFSHTSYAAPGMELIEELTLYEFLKFHFSFKNPIENLSIHNIIQIIGLSDAQHKLMHDFSSGMQQRVKLAQAFFTQSRLLLLDEPCTNLDDAGIELYNHLLATYHKNRLIIIASNDQREYEKADKKIFLNEYK